MNRPKRVTNSFRWYIYKPPSDVVPFFEFGRNFTFITPESKGRWQQSRKYITSNSMLQHTLAPIYRVLLHKILCGVHFNTCPTKRFRIRNLLSWHWRNISLKFVKVQNHKVKTNTRFYICAQNLVLLIKFVQSVKFCYIPKLIPDRVPSILLGTGRIYCAHLCTDQGHF